MQNPKTVEELKKTAVIYWPKEIAEQEKNLSVVPLLLQTQDSFINILQIANIAPDAWITAIKLNKDLYPNLFLKHLCVISDIGGESLKRFATELPPLFKNSPLIFDFHGKSYSHQMESLFRSKKWSNVTLGLDGQNILIEKPMDRAIKDVSMLIIFGSLAISPELPQDITEKCVLGGMLGKKVELDHYIRQRYIWVSRQTGGAKANALGYLIQEYLLRILKKELPDWDFSNKSIDGITERTRGGELKLAKFDIVAKSQSGLCWAIESSFQFTTNSTIERKAGQAPSRKIILNAKGHKIAYAIDGAGNFERSSALQTIIESSDCVINFSKDDILRLANTIKQSVK